MCTMAIVRDIFISVCIPRGEMICVSLSWTQSNEKLIFNVKNCPSMSKHIFAVCACAVLACTIVCVCGVCISFV